MINNGMDIQIIDEKEFTDLLNKNHQLLEPYDVAVGCNIKTGCDVLFDIALKRSRSNANSDVFEKARSVIYSLNDKTIENALGVYYPPDDLSNKGLLKLAHVILKLYEIAKEKHSDHVTEEEITEYLNYADSNLGVRSEVQFYHDSVDRILDESGEQQHD